MSQSQLPEGKAILDAQAITRAVTRICYELIERNKGLQGLCLVGVLTRGHALAQRMAQRLAQLEGVEVPVGSLDVRPFRDDRTALPPPDASQIHFPLEGRKVVLVDDVIYTGRTARAAIDALFSRGRPVRLQLAVLVDRGHRELPLHPDYVGKNLPTARSERVRVLLTPTDSCDAVLLTE